MVLLIFFFLMIRRPPGSTRTDTRSLHDALPIVLLEPLLAIVPRDAVDWPEGHQQAQALLVSSANGVRAFARADSRRGLPVYAVGGASAAAARQCGLDRGESAGGDGRRLEERRWG